MPPNQLSYYRVYLYIKRSEEIKIFTALTKVLSDLLMKGKFSTSMGMRNCGVLQFKNKNKTKPKSYRLLPREQVLKLQHSKHRLE